MISFESAMLLGPVNKTLIVRSCGKKIKLDLKLLFLPGTVAYYCIVDPSKTKELCGKDCNKFKKTLRLITKEIRRYP